MIAKPERVLRMLRELAPLSAIGPVSLREVRDVLTPRLSTLTHEPPRRRHGRVFVGTPSAARGRSFRVVFVPGLAERMFPQKIREDSLLPDHRREAADAGLATQQRRAADERLQLTLAVGAAAERLYVSFPRIELNESRPRVPSFYVLDIDARDRRTHSARAGHRRTRARRPVAPRWRGRRRTIRPRRSTTSSTTCRRMAALLATDAESVKGRARYLYELSPELQRSLTSRWLRWHRQPVGTRRRHCPIGRSDARGTRVAALGGAARIR